MSIYWVMVISTGFLFGLIWALVAGVVLLPFILGVMQRAAPEIKTNESEKKDESVNDEFGNGCDDDDFPKKNWFVHTGRAEDLTSDTMPIRPLDD